MPRHVLLPKAPPGDAPQVDLDLQAAWKLYDRQARFVGNDGLFSLFLGGVGSGKSHALTCWVIRRALANPGGDGALLGRTSIDLATVLLPSLFDRLQEIQDLCGVSLIKDYDKGNAKLTLVNGCTIWFRPYNRIAKLRGLTLTFGAADEVEWSEADPDEVWSVLTGRLRGKGPLPGLAFATSPNGLRGITKRFVDAQRSYLDAPDRVNSSYHVTTATSFANPYLPEHFFDSLRSMSKKRYQQEVEGRVLRPAHTVLDLEPRHFIPHDWRSFGHLPRVYGVDWGTQDHHVAVMFHVEPSGRWVACDELVCDGIPRGQFFDRLCRWVDGHGSAAPAMFGVDRACPSENQNLAHRYRHSTVCWMESREDQKVNAGIEMMRDAMDPANGEPVLMFSTALKQTFDGITAPLIPALRGYCYILGPDGVPTTRPKKDNTNDHMVDAARYAWHGSANRPDLHGGRSLWVPAIEAKRPDAAGQPGKSSSHLTLVEGS
jgi:hypothetical protein